MSRSFSLFSYADLDCRSGPVHEYDNKRTALIIGLRSGFNHLVLDGREPMWFNPLINQLVQLLIRTKIASVSEIRVEELSQDEPHWPSQAVTKTQHRLQGLAPAMPDGRGECA